MNLQLERLKFTNNGIFGQLVDNDGNKMFSTLEHSYNDQPKLPSGVYSCVRGQHQLLHMTQPFETFEITNVPGHSDILFHVGNFNSDSEGCVLLGTDANDTQILNSRVAFQKFMNLQYGVNVFTLIVE